MLFTFCVNTSCVIQLPLSRQCDGISITNSELAQSQIQLTYERNMQMHKFIHRNKHQAYYI